MALLNPYCSVAAVRSELRNNATAGQSGYIADSLIEDAINAASRFIDEYKGRDYLYHNHSSTVLKLGPHSNAIFGTTLFLPYRPCITLTVVEVQGETWVEGTDFIIHDDRERLICVNRESWPVEQGPDYWTHLTGTFGYVQANSAAIPTGLPDRIAKAAVLIAANLTGYAQKDVRGLDGNKVTILDKSIPKEALMLLGNRPLMV